MKALNWIIASFLLIAVVPSHAHDRGRDETRKPLVLARQGSFFVGGETKSGPIGDITVNQMYVQYQIPTESDRHVPIVMVHGCCLSSKTWETTPDGRMGWNDYFVRKNRAVYSADQVGRARSGFDSSIVTAVKSGTLPPDRLPNVTALSHQIAWSLFRFGPSFNTPFSDTQFPVDAADQLYKQMIPDLSATLPSMNPTWKDLATLAVQLHGSVLMGHSQSGFFPQQAALIDPSGIRGIVSIETPCVTTLTQSQVSLLAKIPTLIMFGDHLDMEPLPYQPVSWSSAFDSCQKFARQLKEAGGDVELMHLPELGIRGNSHMLMQDRNNLQLADLILVWVGKHVEGKNTARHH